MAAGAGGFSVFGKVAEEEKKREERGWWLVACGFSVAGKALGKGTWEI